MSEFGAVRDRDLFKKIKDEYNNKKSTYNFSKKLRDGAEFYAAFSDPDSEVWTMFDQLERKSIGKSIYSLNLFGVNQYNPLLLSCLSHSPGIFPEVIELVVMIAFRYSMIGAGGTGNIERAISDAALLLRKHPSSTIEDVFAKVSHLYPNDDQFVTDFSVKKVTQSGLARYILRTINDFLDDSGQIVNPDAYTVNLEHILPKKFREDDWEGFRLGGDIEIVDFIDRIGNMTLLKGALNTQISNKSFVEKKIKYLDHTPLQVARYVYNQDTWTHLNVDENQALLATTASRIWCLPYAKQQQV